MTASDELTVSSGLEIVEQTGPSTERSPVDVLRLVVALTVAALGVLISVADEDALLGFEEDALRFVNGLPGVLERFCIGLAQVVALIYPVVVTVAFVATRRLRGLLVAAVAGVVAAGGVGLVEHFVDRPLPPGLDVRVRSDSWIAGADFPNSLFLGFASALAIVIGSYFGPRWRHAAWGYVGLVAFLRVMSGTEVPIDVIIAVAIGGAAGAASLLAFGAPTHRPTGQQIANALARGGLPLQRLAPASVDARGSTPWFATTTDGSDLFVKVLGRDERDADLLFRVYRSLRLRNVGDQRPFSSLRRAVEHEALVSLKALDDGVRTPRLRVVATVAPDGVLLAYDAVEGSSLDRSEQPPSDELLRALWQQVALLRRDRIAHRDLRRANVFVDGAGVPWLIDFGFSELAATDRMLDQDVAQLLAATAVVVGPERAVDAAVDALGTTGAGTSLAYMQPPAFAGATRKAMSEQKGLLQSLHQEVMKRTDTSEIQYEPLTRLSLRTALMLISSLVAIYVLIPQLGDVEGMFRQLGDASWSLIGVVVLLSMVTYLGAALSLVGACPVPVRYGDAVQVSLAGSFVNRITPAGVGGIGLNLRFMQKSGAETTEAASRWGVNALAGGLVHISLTIVFLLWAGKENAFDFRLPEMPLLVGLLVVSVAAGVVFVVPWGRGRLLGPALKVARNVRDGVISVAHQPGRLALMFCGGAIVTLGYLFGLYAAVHAFGGGLALSAVGAVYLAGSAIGQAAPAPGGLGAVEAALIAGLVSVGLEKEVAVPAVLLFRFATFWIPILPGWIAFTTLSRRGNI